MSHKQNIYTVPAGTAVWLWEHKSGGIHLKVVLKESVSFTGRPEVYRSPGTKVIPDGCNIYKSGEYVFDMTSKKYEGNPYRFMVVSSDFVSATWGYLPEE